MPDNVFDDNGDIRPDAGDKGLIELVLSDTRGIYIPRDFAELYGTDYGIKPDDMTILLAGPDHEVYWDTWNAVLDYAEYVDDNGHMWKLHQDGDLFIYRYG